MHRLLKLTVICLAQLLSIVTTAQQITSATNGDSSRNFAIIIGISNYKFIRPLTYADRDASLFRDFLKTTGGGKIADGNIFCLLNEEALSANFWVKGMQWLRSKDMKAGDRLYIYLAGHGDAINQDEYFFLTYDCNPAGDKNNYIITGNIQLYNLKSRIGEYVRKGIDVFLIMDACRSNELPGGNEGQQILNNAISEKKTGEIIMLATGAGQESLEDAAIGTGHGLFTYYLVDGLSGFADASGNNDKRITLSELQTYINGHVPTIAQEKYNRKQEPFFCCNENAEKNIVAVDSIFLSKWTAVKQLKDISGNEMDAIARGPISTRAITDEVNDTSFLDSYYKFAKAIKGLNLAGNDTSAENYLITLSKMAPEHQLVQQARATLAAELINYAQTKINLYLQGRDEITIQNMRSQFDDAEEDEDIHFALNRLEKIAKQDYTKTGVWLEKAINYLDPVDSILARRIQSKIFYFKAQGFFDKGNKTMDYVEAIKFARLANQADNNAAYTLNTLASLYIQSNQFDSALAYAYRAAQIAPRWRYPYLNIAYILNKTNHKDSALTYYQTALVLDSTNADVYVDLGRFFYERRQLDSALQYYKKALLIDKQNVYAHNNLGWILKEKRQYGDAIQEFRKSIEIDPSLFSSYNGLSKTFSDVKQYDSARLYYIKAMQRYPDRITTTNYLGNFYKKLHQYDSAFYYYKQAITFDPEDNVPYLNIAKTYMELKQYDSAITYFRFATQNSAGNATAYTQMGNLFRGLKQYDSATVYYAQAYDAQPTYTPALNNLALSYLEQKKYDSAKYFYNKAITLDPYNAYLYNNAALAYKEQYRMDTAALYFQKAISLNPSIKSAYNNLGWIYREQHKYDLAKYIFREGSDKNPYNTESLNNLISLFKFLNQYDSARVYFAKNIEQYPGNPAAYNSLGNFYFEVKSYDSALVNYKRAIGLDNEYAIAYNNIGAVYNEINWYDSAIYFYKKALVIDTAYVNAHFNLGLSFYNFEKYDSALVYFNNAVRLNPSSNYYYYFLASAYAMKKNVPDCLLNLKLALEKGYNDYYNVLHDEDLKIIRNTEEYKKLVADYVPEKFIKQLEAEKKKLLEEAINTPTPSTPAKKKKERQYPS